jgi:hypothetical protein
MTDDNDELTDLFEAIDSDRKPQHRRLYNLQVSADAVGVLVNVTQFLHLVRTQNSMDAIQCLLVTMDSVNALGRRYTEELITHLQAVASKAQDAGHIATSSTLDELKNIKRPVPPEGVDLSDKNVRIISGSQLKELMAGLMGDDEESSDTPYYPGQKKCKSCNTYHKPRDLRQGTDNLPGIDDDTTA